MSDKEQKISGIEFGKLLEAVKNLHTDVRDIKTGMAEGFKAGGKRMRQLEVEHGKFKGALWVLGIMIPILIGAAKLIWR